MKPYNTNVGKVKLRREQFNRAQTKSNNKGKKSLSKRIIAERVDGITKNNIDKEVESLTCVAQIDGKLADIMYHIKFGKDTKPSVFNDDVIIGVLERIKDLETKFLEGKITAKEHLELLEEIDAQIEEKLYTFEQCK